MIVRARTKLKIRVISQGKLIRFMLLKSTNNETSMKSYQPLITKLQIYQPMITKFYILQDNINTHLKSISNILRKLQGCHGCAANILA